MFRDDYFYISTKAFLKIFFILSIFSLLLSNVIQASPFNKLSNIESKSQIVSDGFDQNSSGKNRGTDKFPASETSTNEIEDEPLVPLGLRQRMKQSSSKFEVEYNKLKKHPLDGIQTDSFRPPIFS